MDKNFLEFWGNTMLTAAKGQKQMEEMTNWMEKGFSGMKEMNDMFLKFYGIQTKESEKQNKFNDFEAMQKEAFSNFSHSFEAYLQLFDAIPRKKHVELVKKYEALKKQVQDQEETITHLRMMMEDRGERKTDVVEKLNEIVGLQSDQFKKLMNEFSSIGTVDAPQKKQAAPKAKSAPKKSTAKKTTSTAKSRTAGKKS
ncbi:MAG: hypothetical protein GY729_00165 [Desulfobacteraceae bacterium]|nr:hypothetical protein [Desulfobacteraceae bacterium]